MRLHMVTSAEAGAAARPPRKRAAARQKL
jgi:hypothetical protein